MKAYIKEKISLLRDFGITLNSEQLKHIKSLKTEIAVDNFAHDLLHPCSVYVGGNTKPSLAFGNRARRETNWRYAK